MGTNGFTRLDRITKNYLNFFGKLKTNKKCIIIYVVNF